MTEDKYLGKCLEGRYTIVNIIGQGGMSTVYGAYDEVSGNSVAIKIMSKKYDENTEQIRNFINESTALSVLNHPNIVMVYHTAISSDIKFFVMEYVEGTSLKKYMELNGPIEEKELLHYTRQILSALSYIHSKNIVHCDIKPQNIILLQSGNIKVADFGISRLSSLIGNGETSEYAQGTVYYVSPEQASGKLPGKESDIYSLGITLYELATGKLPFYHKDATTVAKMHIQREPAPPSYYNRKLSYGFEQIILRAMEKDIQKRYRTADEMLYDIDQLLRNENKVFESEKSAKYRNIDREAFTDVPPTLSESEHSFNIIQSVIKTGSRFFSGKLPETQVIKNSKSQSKISFDEMSKTKVILDLENEKTVVLDNEKTVIIEKSDAKPLNSENQKKPTKENKLLKILLNDKKFMTIMSVIFGFISALLLSIIIWGIIFLCTPKNINNKLLPSANYTEYYGIQNDR